jgi:hypothetical protein
MHFLKGKMRHTSRLLLIPEEMYHGLLGADGSAKGMVEARMASAATDPKLNADARALKYHQEFKRYSKLAREEEERPVDVKLQNLQEIANVVQQNQPPPPPPTLFTKKKVEVSAKRQRRSGIPVGGFRKKKQVVGMAKQQIDVPEESNSSSNNRHDQAMRYIRANAADLGVDMGSGQVISTGSTSGSDSAAAALLRTSNINEIVGHLLRNAGVRRLPLPVGYDQFKRRADRHQSFKKIYEKQQEGKGIGIYYKKASNRGAKVSPFRFKPSLWS